MAKRIELMAGVIGVLCLGAVAAEAGRKEEAAVTIGSSSSERWARGAMGSARASANAVDEIGCAVWGNTRWLQVSCWAQSVAGGSFFCATTEPRIVQAAAGIGSASYISVASDLDDNCTSLYVSNRSKYKPMVP
jgi:hypothetical protein